MLVVDAVHLLMDVTSHFTKVKQFKALLSAFSCPILVSLSFPLLLLS